MDYVRGALVWVRFGLTNYRAEVVERYPAGYYGVRIAEPHEGKPHGMVVAVGEKRIEPRVAGDTF